MQDVITLRRRLVFADDTAVSGTCRESTPSAGHCAAVALIVQYLFGGEFVSTPMPGGSHWFNRIDGWDIDLTGDQFGRAPVQAAPAGTLYHCTRVRSRDEVNAETAARAALLARRSGLK